MKQKTNTPNKKIRTILLGLILVIYLGTAIYLAITKDANNLAGSSMESNYHDYYEEDEYYDDEYYDDYEDEYDDYYYDDYNDGELSVTSPTVTSLYSYIKLYPYVTNIKSNFKVADLTQEEKMRLVAASLKSQNITTSQPVADITETTLLLNNKIYSLTTPPARYERYEVVSMYSEIFGSSYDMDFSTIMYDGDGIAYKYNESANGYIKYVSADYIPTNNPNPEIVKATKKAGTIEISLKVGTQTEKYLFTQQKGYQYIYQLAERTIDQPKNSL
jgi:hypothetical protein